MYLYINLNIQTPFGFLHGVSVVQYNGLQWPLITYMPQWETGTYFSEGICPVMDRGHSPWREYAPTGIGDIFFGEYIPQWGLGT